MFPGLKCPTVWVWLPLKTTQHQNRLNVANINFSLVPRPLTVVYIIWVTNLEWLTSGDEVSGIYLPPLFCSYMYNAKITAVIVFNIME